MKKRSKERNVQPVRIIFRNEETGREQQSLWFLDMSNITPLMRRALRDYLLMSESERDVDYDFVAPEHGLQILVNYLLSGKARMREGSRAKRQANYELAMMAWQTSQRQTGLAAASTSLFRPLQSS